MEPGFFVFELLLIRANPVRGGRCRGRGSINDRGARCWLRAAGDEDDEQDDGRDSDHQPHLELARQYAARLLTMVVQ
jgi:hypothetical protein